MSQELLAPICEERLQALLPDYNVEIHASIDSTQARALRLAQAADRPRLPLLIVAEEQTAGRGRGTNRWWTGRGSLAFSLLIDPADWSLSREPRPIRSLAVGVAVVEVVSPLVKDRCVGLHWPNDVFVEERKLGGILIDVTAGGLVVIGVGLNVNNTLEGAPDEVRARATSLIERRHAPADRAVLLADLLNSIRRCLRDCEAQADEFGARFDAVCLQHGENLTVQTGSESIGGVCRGIATDGALILETSAGLRRIYSGTLR